MASSTSSVIALAAGVVLALGASRGAPAQPPPLSARDSDPRVMGWMQGFPPPPDRLITQLDSNYFSFPKLRWSVCHLRELLPTEAISRGLGAPVPLRYPSPLEFAEMRQAIDALTFMPMNGAEEMTWEESLLAH